MFHSRCDQSHEGGGCDDHDFETKSGKELHRVFHRLGEVMNREIASYHLPTN